jgi:hypothetical protein
VHRQHKSVPCNLPLIERSFLLARPSLPRNYPQEVFESRLFLCILEVECTREEGQRSQDWLRDGYRHRRQVETFLVNQNVPLSGKESRSVQVKNGIHLASSKLGNQLVRFIRTDEKEANLVQLLQVLPKTDDPSGWPNLLHEVHWIKFWEIYCKYCKYGLTRHTQTKPNSKLLLERNKERKQVPNAIGTCREITRNWRER